MGSDHDAGGPSIGGLAWRVPLLLRAVTAAKPTAGAFANLIMPMERAYDFDALHPVAISNAGEDQSALLNQLG